MTCNFTNKLKPLYVILLFVSLTLAACSDSKINIDKSIQQHAERSRAYKNQGQLRAAIIEARNIINLDKSQTLGYEMLAQLYLDLGNYKSAVSILEHIDNNPKPEISLLIATAYARQGKFISSDKLLKQYLLQGGDVSSIDYKLVQATVLAGTKQLQAAIKITNDLIEDYPENLDARVLLSSIYLADNNYDLAKTTIKTTLAEFPREPEALYMAAQIAHHENDLDRAERLLSKAISNMSETDILLPLRLKTLSSLSTVLTKKGRTTEALIYSKLIASYSPEATDAKIKFGRALELLNSGDIDSAEAIFQDLYATYPNNEKTAFYLALINYQKGNLDTADNLFTSHLDTETAPDKLIEAATLNSLKLNKTQQAINILEKALLTHNDNPLLLGLYGVSILHEPGTEEAALLNIQKSLAINPDQDDLRLILARFYLKKGLPEQAKAHLNIILKNDPDNIDAINIYLNYLVMDNNIDEADKVAKQLLNSESKNPEALNLIANYKLRNQQVAEAKSLYQTSVELDPGNLEALHYLAYIAIDEKEFSHAISLYKQIILNNPASPSAYKSLFATLETTQGEGTALDTLLAYTRAPFEDQARATANAVVAEYYLLRSDLDNAQKYISAANSIDSTTTYTTSITAQVEYLQARQAIAQQDWGTARNLLMSALNNSEQELAASRLLIEVELESGNLGEAQRLINNLMEQYPAEDTLLLAQARLYELQGDPAKALQYLQSKWYNNASPTLAYNIYQRLNPDPEKQVDFLIKWSRQQPDNDRPLSYLALNAQRSGNNTVAINYYAQAAQLNPRSPSTLNNLAWLYYETNNPLALETAKKAYQLAPDNAAILDTYGWILVVNGKRQEGIELLEKALELATPSDIEGIKSHLSQAKSG